MEAPNSPFSYRIEMSNSTENQRLLAPSLAQVILPMSPGALSEMVLQGKLL